MTRKHKNIALFLFVLLSAMILERTIPHVHEINEGMVNIDFSHQDKDSHDEEEAEEKIHSTVYQLVANDISFSCHTIIKVIQLEIVDFKLLENPQKTNFNILPKILNSIVYLIHYYSSTAPPHIL